jgi:hypothetical protein
MRDVLECIVHHHGQLIGGESVSPANDKITDLARQLLTYLALGSIAKTDGVIVRTDPQGPGRLAGGQTVTTGARIDRASRRVQPQS